MAEAEANVEAKMTFPSGQSCCVTTNPDNYKVVANIANVARLVEMTMKPGDEDSPHEHPSHSMYFVTAAKLEIRDMNDKGELGEPHAAEIPAGAAPIFPAGGHQVKNVGEADVKVLFVEEYPNAPPAPAAAADFLSPFDTDASCYTKLAENDKWITGIMEMESTCNDHRHNHQDHLIYVLEGDEITIYPGDDKEKGQQIPIKANAGIPAPISAGPIFANHSLKNSGKEKAKLLFFERKASPAKAPAAAETNAKNGDKKSRTCVLL